MKKILTIIFLASVLFSSCKKDNELEVSSETEGKAALIFDTTVGSIDFALNKDYTINAKTFNFTQFRYWLSNVILINEKGEEFKVSGSNYLLEETGVINLTGVNNDKPTTIYPATKRDAILLKEIPAGDYKVIKFGIGVDQKYNDNLSLQSGELSQLNGMTNVSWMWLTSYIFTSVSGKITEGSVTKNILVETGMNANYKTVSIDLPQSVHIGSNKETEIVLNLDLAKALDGLNLVTTPIVGASQSQAMETVALNYETKVFSVKSLK